MVISFLSVLNSVVTTDVVTFMDALMVEVLPFRAITILFVF